jgi:hypothetical protein
MKRYAVFVSILAIAFSGCGKARPVKVAGTITLDGRPLSGATIVFSPEQEAGGRQASALSDSEGTFELTTYNMGDGALPGTYKVLVKKDEPHIATALPKEQSPEEVTKMMADYAKRKSGPTVETKKKPIVPAAYSSPTSTPLKYTVPVEDKLEIKLKSNAS